MDIDASTTAPREQMASRDTALACLAQLAVQNGLDPTVAAARRGNVLDDDTLPVSRLIELAGDFEFQAEHARVDWQGLLTIGFTDPILVLLKNTNVAILTGGGRNGAEEVAVWDPLHRDSEILFVPRQDFERAWSGDVLRVMPQPTGKPPPSLELHGATSEQLPDTGKQQLSRGGKRLSPLIRLCLLAIGIVAPVGGGLFLFSLPAAENFMSSSASVSQASEQATKATPSKPGAASGRAADQEVVSVAPIPAPPTPNMPQSNTAVAGSTTSDEPLPEETKRLAALPPEGSSTGEVSALQPSPVVPMTPPAPGAVTAEADTSGSTSAPVIPPADATLSSPEIAVLLTRGDKSFSSGDVASARLYYGHAANAGDAQAALRLGETFDPVFLEHAHLRSVRGDLAVALSWYRRARAMGAAEAEVLLNSLEAK